MERLQLQRRAPAQLGWLSDGSKKAGKVTPTVKREERPGRGHQGRPGTWAEMLWREKGRQASPWCIGTRAQKYNTRRQSCKEIKPATEQWPFCASYASGEGHAHSLTPSLSR